MEGSELNKAAGLIIGSINNGTGRKIITISFKPNLKVFLVRAFIEYCVPKLEFFSVSKCGEKYPLTSLQFLTEKPSF